MSPETLARQKKQCEILIQISDQKILEDKQKYAMIEKNEEFIQFCRDDKATEVKDALDKGQDPNCTDKRGNTGLIEAVYRSKLVMTILLQHPQLDINIANEHGLTALHYAASIGNYIAIKMLGKKRNFYQISRPITVIGINFMREMA